MSFILTSKVGSNKDQFPDILSLYVPKPAKILDMTWGKGVFWKKVEIVTMIVDPPWKDDDGYQVWPNDLNSEKGAFHYDFGNLPEDWTEVFDAVVLDPPYLLTGGFKTLKDSIDRGYENRERASRGIKGVVGVVQMYAKGALEAHRVLKPKGIFIVKTMDQVESGKQQWLSIRLITLFDLLGFDSVDWFVITMPGMPTMRHDKQDHARRNHSYFLVFRKRGKWGR